MVNNVSVTNNFQALLQERRNNLALIIGNGINMHGKSSTTNSWKDLLMSLAKNDGFDFNKDMPSGIILTEFYDLLEIKSTSINSKKSLQKDFCTPMQDWKPYKHHKSIVAWAEQNQIPILTTNFDDVLAQAGDHKLLSQHTKGFTDFYPWDSYFGSIALDRPDQGFGIWHINGMMRYKRSIRLGLTHYMGSVARARNLIHGGSDRNLFSGKNAENWAGVETWLHIIFNKPLLIFGLALNENEVFLRWLLIERAKYFKKFPKRRHDAWYVYNGGDEKKNEGKLYFLNGIGVIPVKVDSYEELYGVKVWQ